MDPRPTEQPFARFLAANCQVENAPRSRWQTRPAHLQRAAGRAVMAFAALWLTVLATPALGPYAVLFVGGIVVMGAWWPTPTAVRLRTRLLARMMKMAGVGLPNN